LGWNSYGVAVDGAGPMNDDGSSILDDNARIVQAWLSTRPRAKGPQFNELAEQLRDPMLAEMIWILYGEDSLRVIDMPLQAINQENPWWRFRKKNTVRSLSETCEGKRRLWQMLHDASAWM